MQPDSNPVRLNDSIRNGPLTLTPDARIFLCRQRPELAAAFDGLRIRVPHLLTPATTSISQSQPSTHTPGSTFVIRHSSLPLGDLVAALLHRLRIDAIVGLLQRRGWLRGCQCAARQARLNALPPRLRSLLEPLPQTLALILAWLIFAVALLLR